ncbi:OsmC family protein [Acaricomes phytoseiuli]|uniref:OsmC family protein n=1 Tax=Acaricomes phytoseiuli TaxID=291968 RepID=UPI00038245F8|nr:OsmC family protein [Acaricomes phytoseiuli]
MPAEHRYRISTEWTGNRGTGTSGYRDYSRNHVIRAEGLPELLGSADRAFHGDRERWNPELLLLAALSECHMLSFLHVALRHDVRVTAYRDQSEAALRLNPDGSGEFSSATLRPEVETAEPVGTVIMQQLHAEASALCFMARSVNFPVRHELSENPERPEELEGRGD